LTRRPAATHADRDMQRVYISAGKALCRFCGEQISTNSLSTHIAKEHPRPRRGNLSPRLVSKRDRKKGSGTA
jgi:hypothetical protein